MSVKLLTEHHLEFQRFKGGCTGSSESTLVKIPHCWKSHVMAHILVMVDQFTKWVELAALPAQSTELTARAVLNHFVVTFGCPLEIYSSK